MNSRNESGVNLAEEVVRWYLFNGAGTMKAGELRGHIAAIFGSDVDAALAAKFASFSIPENGTGEA